MTTLGNRPATALLVIDVQNAAVDGSYQRDAVVANIGSLVEKARREHVPVIWVQHSDEELERGSGDWQIVPELNPDGSEPLVEKHYGDSFEDTTLEDVLSGLRVGRLVVVGAQTDACVRSTLHGAFARGYDATLVSDAHTTEDQTKWGAPPPDQVIVMSRTPVPTGLPWVSALSRVPKSSIWKSSSIHVARPLPGDTATDRSGTRVVQNSPVAGPERVKPA